MSDDILEPKDVEEEEEEEEEVGTSTSKSTKKGGKKAGGTKKGGKPKGVKGPFKSAEEKKDEDTDKLKLTKEEKEQLKDLKGEEKEKWIIRKKLVENQWRDKADQHEVSLEDEQLVNAAGPVPGPTG